MRASLVALLFVFGCSSDSPVNSETSQYELPGWSLVWQDEFDGTDIDPSKWTHEVHGNPHNNELQYYTARSKNSRVEDGRLVIEAHAETYTDVDGTRQYTSSRMVTRNNGDWKYGRFDIRAKLPRGQGIWPAIWMMPTDNTYGGWSASGEIDIVELLGHEPKKTHGTLHYGGTGSDHASSGDSMTLNSGSFADDYHLFTLEWEEGVFHWYVDGLRFLTRTQWHTVGHPYPAPFDQRFFMILNVAVGGDWPGSPNASTPFPQAMEVDYVRVYEPAQ